MSECQSKDDDVSNDCSPAPPSVNHLLRASAIVATGVFLAITVVLLICILHKRRMSLFGCFRSGPRRAPHLPALYVWSASEPAAPSPPEQVTANPARGKSPKGGSPVVESLSCVIMAGEERPTHLAQPLPQDEFVDVSLDLYLDEQKRGKR